jgi:hypothetical protein
VVHRPATNGERGIEDQATRSSSTTPSKYGFTINELGPALQQRKLGEQAAQLVKEWSAVEAAGISVDNIGIRMSDSISK